jgi:release factor glutamine methyltransferase
VFGRGRAWVLAHPDERLETGQREAYFALVERRAGGQPVAYLRGYTEWYGLQLEVSPAVLVPRPETELLAERATELARSIGARRVADVGTGSGAIAVVLAHASTNWKVYAVDRSIEALRVAERNLTRHGVRERVDLLHGDLLAPLAARPDLIVANLPYLSDDMMLDLADEVRREPVCSLHGGRTGLELYARLLQQMRDRGWSIPVLLEIDPRQRHEVLRHVQTCFAATRVEVFPDYAGLDRIVSIRPDQAAQE